tara:strand:- start:8390 stop:8854 length:465 start_codon:yes stop_codon:yes gene_type:complete
MAKAKAKKRRVTKPRSSSNKNVDKVLIENFVSLQKVMTNLSLKFDGLSSQISKLLELFEISAKALAQKDFKVEKESENSKEIIKKLNNLADQNKTIARGLTLMHEVGPQNEMQPVIPRLEIPRPQRETRPKQKPDMEISKYRKSISSKDENPRP